MHTRPSTNTMGHHHGHGHHHHHDISGKNILISIILNILITLAQIIGALVSGSLSLLADALHNFSDVAALIISWIANKLAKRDSNESQTFGYKRAEIIAAFVNTATLILVAIYLYFEAFHRFFEPVEVKSVWVMVMAGFSILANGLSVLLVSEDAKHNMNMKSAYLHLLTDMLSSIAVLIGGIVLYFYKVNWVDGALSVLIATYLIYSSWGLFKESLAVLMQFSPSNIDISKIKNEILKLENVKGLHHIHIWRLNEKETHFEGHLEMKRDLKLSELNEIFEKVKGILDEKFNISHCVIQPEFQSDCNKKLIYNSKEEKNKCSHDHDHENEGH